MMVNLSFPTNHHQSHRLSHSLFQKHVVGHNTVLVVAVVVAVVVVVVVAAATAAAADEEHC